MPNESGFRSMLEDGTEMQKIAKSMLEMGERMVSFAKSQLEEDDELEDDEVEDSEEKPSKNKAKDLALIIAKKRRKK